MINHLGRKKKLQTKKPLPSTRRKVETQKNRDNYCCNRANYGGNMRVQRIGLKAVLHWGGSWDKRGVKMPLKIW